MCAWSPASTSNVEKSSAASRPAAGPWTKARFSSIPPPTVAVSHILKQLIEVCVSRPSRSSRFHARHAAVRASRRTRTRRSRRSRRHGPTRSTFITKGRPASRPEGGREVNHAGRLSRVERHARMIAMRSEACSCISLIYHTFERRLDASSRAPLTDASRRPSWPAGVSSGLAPITRRSAYLPLPGSLATAHAARAALRA